MDETATSAPTADYPHAPSLGPHLDQCSRTGDTPDPDPPHDRAGR